MNVTGCDYNSNSYPYNYPAYILAALLVSSEILPLLKSKQNGLFHAIVCIFNNLEKPALELPPSV